LKKSPDSLMLRNLLGLTAVRAGKYGMAVEQYQRALKQAPNSIELQLRLGEVYRLQGDMPNAIATLEKAQQAAPKDPEPLRVLAYTLQRAGRTDEAIKRYRQLVEFSPQPEILNNLAFLLAEQGGNKNLEEAQQLAQRALLSKKNDPSISDTLGWIYLRKNIPDSALRIFQELARTNPDSAIFRYHLAMALFTKGDKQTARRELEAALTKKPSVEDEAKIRELLARVG